VRRGTLFVISRLARLSHTCREWQGERYAAKRANEFSPRDTSCHVTLPRDR